GTVGRLLRGFSQRPDSAFGPRPSMRTLTVFNGSALVSMTVTRALRKFSRVSLYAQNSLVCIGPRSCANNWQQGNAGCDVLMNSIQLWQPDERQTSGHHDTQGKVQKTQRRRALGVRTRKDT